MRVGRGAGQGALSWSRTALGAKVRDDVRVPEGLFIGVGIDCYISSDSPDLGGSADEVQAIARLVGERFSTGVLRDPDEATVSTTHFLDGKALCRRVIRLPSFVYAQPPPRHSSATVTYFGQVGAVGAVGSTRSGVANPALPCSYGTAYPALSGRRGFHGRRQKAAMAGRAGHAGPRRQRPCPPTFSSQ